MYLRRPFLLALSLLVAHLFQVIVNRKASASELDLVYIVLSSASTFSRCSSNKLSMFSGLVELICSDAWSCGLLLVLSIVLHQLQCLIELLLLLIEYLSVVSICVL